MKSIYGYFDDDSQTPAYDPGLDVDCPICNKRLSDPMRTPSFIVPGDGRSYFFRVHRACDENHPGAVDALCEVVVDAIYKTRETN